MGEYFRRMTEGAIEHAALLVRLDPRHGKIAVGQTLRKKAPRLWVEVALIEIDTQKNVQLRPRVVLAKLIDLLLNRKPLALEGGVHRILQILHANLYGVPRIPGMAAVLVTADHLAEFGK